jgi:hypothetical protein
MVVCCGDDLEINGKELLPAKITSCAAACPCRLVAVRNDDDASAV